MRRLTILLAAVGALLLIPAAQAFAVPTTTVHINGSGSGEVTSNNGTPLIACSYNGTSTSGVCQDTPEEPEEGSELYASELIAHPAPGSEVHWTAVPENPEFSFTGNCPRSGEPRRCQVFNFEPSEGNEFEVTATFFKAFPLKVEKTGEGTIVSNPAGITCGVTCEASFEEGKTVTLTASPATGYAFSAWAGCTEHVGLTCKVLMDKAKTVKASFVATPSLTIEKAGSGQGKAGASGISCDENCSKASSAVKTGTSVTVKATPAKGSEAAVFEGGTGSASGCSGAVCTFTISENSSVKVKFSPIPTKTMTVNLTGPAAYKGKVSGKGIVKGLTGAAINCGAGCTSQTESFFSTDEVTLSAAAGTGYTFGGWSVSGGSAGTCTGTTTPCTVKTDANKTLSAKFE